MTHGLTPCYLSNLLPPPNCGRVTRHSKPISTIRCRTLRFDSSFLPDTIKLWNNLPTDIRDSISLQIFKSKLKTTLLAVDNVPDFFSFGHRFSNTCQTQLRLGFSRLNFDLFKVNIIPSPTCSCSSPIEDVTHFFLYCPNYAIQRKKLLDSIIPLLAPGVHPNLIIHTASERLIQILLFGSKELPDSLNIQLFDSVQNYLVESRRFIF